MDLLFLWLLTIIASLVMELAQELRLFKDVADCGYKVDIERLSELSKQLNPNATKQSLYSFLIPIFNIMHVIQNTVQYNNARPMVLDELSVLDVLEEMSDEETNEYQKKPTALNALTITLKTEIKLLNSGTVKFDDKNEKYEIFYEKGESWDDITILKATGTAKNLSIDEQKQKVLEAHNQILNAGAGSVDKFTDEAQNNTYMDLSQSSENKDDSSVQSMDQLSVGEQKQILKNYWDELMNNQPQDNSSNHVPRLNKRKK